MKNDNTWSKLKKINSIRVRINDHKLVNVRMSLNKKVLLLGVLFSLTGFVIIFLAQRYLLFALILNFIFFPLFYLFEKNNSIMFSDLDYQKLRLRLTTAVCGCYLLSFLNFL